MAHIAYFVEDVCPCCPYRLIVLAYCLCIAALSAAQEGKTSCSILPVEPFQDAFLTCTFPENLNVTHKGFSVYHYAKGLESDAVIDCSWLNGKPECVVLPGYEYNEVVSTQLTAIVSRVNTSLTGEYACQISGYPTSSFETCQLQLKHERNETCSASKASSETKFLLICYFSEDVSTRRWNFTVYKHIGQVKLGVVDCWWENERQNCSVEPGYQYNYQLSSNLTVGLPPLTIEEEIYSCWQAGSGTSHNGVCSYKNEADDSDDQGVRNLAIGLSVGLIALAAIITGILYFLYVKRAFSNLCHVCGCARSEENPEEEQPMMEAERVGEDDAEDSPVKKLKETYPDILRFSYFLPPVYFNKTRYIKVSEAGQTVYIAEKPDENDAVYDRAMQRVLHCLRQTAEQGKDTMFVFIQFRHNSLITSTPVKCIDFLVVHRQHGVVAVVVKAVSGNDVEGERNQQQAEVITAQVTEAVSQLNSADGIISDLIKQPYKCIKKLILPNLTKSSLGDAIGNNHKLARDLRECLGLKPTDGACEKCFFGEPSTGWNFSDLMTDSTHDKRIRESSGNISLPVVLYLHITAGSSVSDQDKSLSRSRQITRLLLDVKAVHSVKVIINEIPSEGDDKCFPLPKTLSEAVSLTGDLYERSTLDPKCKKHLSEPIVFLTGAPNTGKTRMLTLVGRKWLYEGRTVVVVKDSSSSVDPFLLLHLKGLAKERPGGSSDDVIDETCNPKKDNSIKEFIRRTNAKTDDKSVAFLLDVAHVQGKDVTRLYEHLRKEHQELHLWVSCTGKEIPSGGFSRHLTRIINCPLAVVREVEPVTDSIDKGGKNVAALHYPYTDGPPVKHIYHRQPVNPWKPELMHDCQECGRDVGSFLAKLLEIGKAAETATEAFGNEPGNQTQVMAESVEKASIPPLRLTDILIVFEFNRKHFWADPDVKEDSEFLNGMRGAGIDVHAKKDEEDDQSISARAMHMRHMQTYRTKKKIVVYVESASSYTDVENKRRALTSCTSQLIVVHPKPKEEVQ